MEQQLKVYNEWRSEGRASSRGQIRLLDYSDAGEVGDRTEEATGDTEGLAA